MSTHLCAPWKYSSNIPTVASQRAKKWCKCFDNLQVLGTDAGGTKEILESNVTGVFHPVGKVGIPVLARHLRWLLDHPDLGIQMGERGRERVSKMYREGPMYDKLARIFIDCVREQGGWYTLFFHISCCILLSEKFYHIVKQGHCQVWALCFELSFIACEILHTWFLWVFGVEELCLTRVMWRFDSSFQIDAPNLYSAWACCRMKTRK